MTAVVISQPMFFPWVGMFEQIRLADVYVHYDDVQFSKGSFTNRVQIKTATGSHWMTVPLHKFSLGQRIEDVKIDNRKDWRASHLAMLHDAYSGTPWRKDMLAIVENVYHDENDSISELSRRSMAACCEYLGIDFGRSFVRIGDLQIGSSSSQRVLEVVKAVGGNRYITGLGGRNYLNHELFEAAAVSVEYMRYELRAYPQLHGEFTPYVSILDLVANVGKAGVNCILSKSIFWNESVINETYRTI